MIYGHVYDVELCNLIFVGYHWTLWHYRFRVTMSIHSLVFPLAWLVLHRLLIYYFSVNYFFHVLDSIFDCSLVKGRDAADVTKFQFNQSLLYHLSINNLSVKLNLCQSISCYQEYRHAVLVRCVILLWYYDISAIDTEYITVRLHSLLDNTKHHNGPLKRPQRNAV